MINDHEEGGFIGFRGGMETLEKISNGVPSVSLS
jgi:hypothetical protein